MSGTSGTQLDAAGQLLTFALGTWTFGVPLASVKEVQRAARVRALFPDAAAPVAVLDLRGESLPVWDLRVLLGLPVAGSGDGFLIVTGEVGDPSRRAWVVDTVTEVLDQSAGQPVGLTGTPFDAMLDRVLRYGSLLVFRLDPRKLGEVAARTDVGAVPATAQHAGPGNRAADGAGGEEMVVFVVGPQRYALPVGWIREIQPISEMTRVPCVPSFVRGVMNLRGGLLSVLDLHEYLGVKRPDSEDISRVLVLDAADLEIGIAAREVVGLVRVANAERLPSMPAPGGVPPRFLDGMLQDLTLILNATALLTDSRLIIDEPRGAAR